MPQTYIRAVPSGRVGTTSPREVSCRRSAGPVPGRGGTSGAGQESTTSSLDRRSDEPRGPVTLSGGCPSVAAMELDEYLPLLQRTNARFAEAASAAVLEKGWTA